MASSPPNEPSNAVDSNRIMAMSTDGDTSNRSSSSRNNLLWDIAHREFNTKKQERIRRLTDRQIILLGTRGGGKSTMLHRVSGRDDKPADSIGLEYTYVRHQLKSSLADEVVGHIWECPPTPYMVQLLKAVANSKNIPFTSVIVCVDLSQPSTIPAALESMLRCVATVIRDVTTVAPPGGAVTGHHDDNGSAALESMKRKALQRCSASNNADASTTDQTAPAADLKHLQPLLIPCWVIGCKYDKFQDYEPEKKNMITKYLRFVARLNGAGLMYFHWKSEQHTKRLKTIMMELTLPPDEAMELSSAANQQQSGATVNSMPPQFDYNKLVFIKPGDDDLAKIGEPPVVGGDAAAQRASGSSRPPALSEPVWRRAYETFIPLTPALEFTQTKSDDINWSQYQEPIVDQIYALKNEVGSLHINEWSRILV